MALYCTCTKDDTCIKTPLPRHQTTSQTTRHNRWTHQAKLISNRGGPSARITQHTLVVSWQSTVNHNHSDPIQPKHAGTLTHTLQVQAASGWDACTLRGRKKINPHPQRTAQVDASYRTQSTVAGVVQIQGPAVTAAAICLHHNSTSRNKHSSPKLRNGSTLGASRTPKAAAAAAQP